MKTNNNQGFTLLELLLAMAIFTLVSLAGYSIMGTMIKSDEVSKAKLMRLNQIQTTFLVLERDLVQLSRRHLRLDGEAPLTGFVHSGNGGFSGGVEQITFVRAGWANPNLMLPRSDLQPVSYQLNNNVFERTHFNFVDADPSKEPRVRQLLDNVVGIKFEFFYRSKWQTELEQDKVPRGIAIELETEDLGIIRRQFLVAGDNA